MAAMAANRTAAGPQPRFRPNSSGPPTHITRRTGTPRRLSRASASSPSAIDIVRPIRTSPLPRSHPATKVPAIALISEHRSISTSIFVQARFRRDAVNCAPTSGGPMRKFLPSAIAAVTFGGAVVAAAAPAEARDYYRHGGYYGHHHHGGNDAAVAAVAGI